MENFEKDLPDWLLCRYCSKFHPVDQNGYPRQRWHSFSEKKWVRVNGVVSIRYEYHVRYEYAQLLMRNYRLGGPYEMYLKKLSNEFTRRLPEINLKGVVTASIVAGRILLKIKEMGHP